MTILRVNFKTKWIFWYMLIKKNAHRQSDELWSIMVNHLWSRLLENEVNDNIPRVLIARLHGYMLTWHTLILSLGSLHSIGIWSKQMIKGWSHCSKLLYIKKNDGIARCHDVYDIKASPHVTHIDLISGRSKYMGY